MFNRRRKNVRKNKLMGKMKKSIGDDADSLTVSEDSENKTLSLKANNKVANKNKPNSSFGRMYQRRYSQPYYQNPKYANAKLGLKNINEDDKLAGLNGSLVNAIEKELKFNINQNFLPLKTEYLKYLETILPTKIDEDEEWSYISDNNINDNTFSNQKSI